MNTCYSNEYVNSGIECDYSEIIAWLMDPSASHNFGTTFINGLLKYAYPSESFRICGTSHIERYTERDDIDILLVYHDSKIVVTIENKTISLQHDRQLFKYYDSVLRLYPSYDHRFIFLDKQGYVAEDIRWVSLDYEALKSVLGQVNDIYDSEMIRLFVKIIDGKKDFQLLKQMLINTPDLCFGPKSNDQNNDSVKNALRDQMYGYHKSGIVCKAYECFSMNSFVSHIMASINERYGPQFCCKIELKKDGPTLTLYLEGKDKNLKEDIFNHLREFKFFNKPENGNHNWVYSKYLCDSYRVGEDRTFVLCRNVSLFIEYTLKDIDEALEKCNFLKI